MITKRPLSQFSLESLYDRGIRCIVWIQYWFKDYGAFFAVMNVISNPHTIVQFMFPLMSIIDSAFAAQLILCMSFGGWFNSIVKWWLLEDRPYWWVRTTNLYTERARPRLNQTFQTCETGPGSPSGHSAAAAMLFVLITFWIQHVMDDYKIQCAWWRPLAGALLAPALASVMLARLHAAAHFPHQALLGGLLGGTLAPLLCALVADPQIWRRDRPPAELGARLAPAAVAAAVSYVTYWSLKACGVDPMWTVDLALRHCAAPATIRVSSNPMYSLVEASGHMFGSAIAIAPPLAKYRYYTRNRSLIISLASTAVCCTAVQRITKQIPNDLNPGFMGLLFLLQAMKTVVLLRVCPFLATWAYGPEERVKKR